MMIAEARSVFINRNNILNDPRVDREFDSMKLKFDRFVSELSGDQVGILDYPHFLWDLLYPPTFYQDRNSGPKQFRFSSEWSCWINSVWRKELEILRKEDEPLRVKQLLTAIQSVASKDENEIPEEWSWAGGKQLLTYVLGSKRLDEILGHSLYIDLILQGSKFREGQGFFLRGKQVNSIDPKLSAGTKDGGAQIELKASSAGLYRERVQGPLPTNLARLSPIELAYSDAVPEYFRYRIATNSLTRRVHEIEFPSSKISPILICLVVHDDVELYKWGNEPAQIERFRGMFFDLINFIIDLTDNTSIELQLIIKLESYQYIGEIAEYHFSQSELNQFRQMKQSDIDRIAFLHRRMPELHSQWPVKPRTNRSLPYGNISDVIEIHLSRNSLEIEKFDGMDGTSAAVRRFLIQSISKSTWKIIKMQDGSVLKGTWIDTQKNFSEMLFGVSPKIDCLADMELF